MPLVVASWEHEGEPSGSDILVSPCHTSSVKEIRDQWPGKLIIKGILDTEDARLCKSIGAEAIIVSNHGGRQLEFLHVGGIHMHSF